MEIRGSSRERRALLPVPAMFWSEQRSYPRSLAWEDSDDRATWNRPKLVRQLLDQKGGGDKERHTRPMKGVAGDLLNSRRELLSGSNLWLASPKRESTCGGRGCQRDICSRSGLLSIHRVSVSGCKVRDKDEIVRSEHKGSSEKRSSPMECEHSVNRTKRSAYASSFQCDYWAPTWCILLPPCGAKSRSARHLAGDRVRDSGARRYHSRAPPYCWT